MCITKETIQRLDARQPRDGIWLGLLRSIETLRASWSVVSIVNRGIERKSRRDHPWTTETLIPLLVLLDVCMLLIARPLTISWWLPVLLLLQLWVLYRTLDIFLFAVGWVFVHRGALHSNRRSLLGFMLNLLELAILSASAKYTLLPTPTDPKWRVVIVDFSRLITLSPPTFPEGVFASTQWVDVASVIPGAFLLLVILAGLAGSIVRASTDPT